MSFSCLVCFYNYLEEPPYDENGKGTDIICPCCGFHYGCDDFPNKKESYSIWRSAWVAKGCEWWATWEYPNKDFDYSVQLDNIFGRPDEELKRNVLLSLNNKNKTFLTKYFFKYLTIFKNDSDIENFFVDFLINDEKEFPELTKIANEYFNEKN